MKFFFLIFSSLILVAQAATLTSNEVDAAQVFKIDFTKSELTFDKNNKLEKFPMQEMEKIAKDHAAKIKGELTGVSLMLNPILENKEYSHFFTFNLKTNSYSSDKKDFAEYNCFAITNKNFTHYSAACSVVKK